MNSSAPTMSPHARQGSAPARPRLPEPRLLGPTCLSLACLSLALSAATPAAQAAPVIGPVADRPIDGATEASPDAPIAQPVLLVNGLALPALPQPEAPASVSHGPSVCTLSLTDRLIQFAARTASRVLPFPALVL